MPVPPGPDPVIRTPDQRLRVFVSSTLRELAAERRSAREAVCRFTILVSLYDLAPGHPERRTGQHWPVAAHNEAHVPRHVRGAGA